MSLQHGFKLFREEGQRQEHQPLTWRLRTLAHPAQGMMHAVKSCHARHPGDDKNLKGKPLVKHVMSSWINAGDSLVSMVATRLLIQVLGWMWRWFCITLDFNDFIIL